MLLRVRISDPNIELYLPNIIYHPMYIDDVVVCTVIRRTNLILAGLSPIVKSSPWAPQ